MTLRGGAKRSGTIVSSVIMAKLTFLKSSFFSHRASIAPFGAQFSTSSGKQWADQPLEGAAGASGAEARPKPQAQANDVATLRAKIENQGWSAMPRPADAGPGQFNAQQATGSGMTSGGNHVQDWP
jgi:hypothetical protein